MSRRHYHGYYGNGVPTLAFYGFVGMAGLTLIGTMPPGVLLVPAAVAVYWVGWKIARWIQDRRLARRRPPPSPPPPAATATPSLRPRPGPVPPKSQAWYSDRR